MLPAEIDILELTAEDLQWPFHGNSNSGPYFRFGGNYEYVDPFPAYAHDARVVKSMLRNLTSVWPPGTELLVAITDRETTSRTNAFASRGHGEQPNVICLSGKRIPPHPAMTRYLCAHEYGHNVQYWLEKAQDLDHDAVLEQYIDLRKPTKKGYGGQRWHDNVGEVFACDFRIIVCGVETEFWPHHGVPRPEDAPGVSEWWTFAQRSWLDHLHRDTRGEDKAA